jgi:hypothetical protein
MTPLITVHIVLGTICLTVSLIHLLISFRKENSRTDLLFSLMAFGIAGGLYLDTVMYRAASVEVFNTAFKTHIYFDVLLWISLIWFIGAYTGTARRPLLILSTLCYAVAGIANALSPYGVLYGEITGLETLTLAWGEMIVYAVGTPNPWRYVAESVAPCPWGRPSFSSSSWPTSTEPSWTSGSSARRTPWASPSWPSSLS